MLKFQSFGHLMWRTDSLEKPVMLGKIEAGGEGNDRGWDGWMALPTRWTWVWASSRGWWWTRMPGVLQRVRHDWATELNWVLVLNWTFLMAQMVKRLSTMWETQDRSLGQEDPLKKEMAIHSSTIVWKIPWTEEPSRLQSMGSQRVGRDWVTSHFPCRSLQSIE